MQLRDAYPADAVGGCCLVTHRSNVGEPIVDLDTYVETLQPFGRLCISADGVRLLMNQLGWVLPEDDVADENAVLRAVNDALALENRRLKQAIQQVVDASLLADLTRVAELAETVPEVEAVG